jgi:hypothetical protein
MYEEKDEDFVIEHGDKSVVGCVELSTERHVGVSFEVDGTDVSATLADEDRQDTDYVIGVEDSIDINGEQTRRYLKIPTYLRSAASTAVEYYESREALKKGVAAVGVVAGVIAVGSLVVLRVRKKG